MFVKSFKNLLKTTQQKLYTHLVLMGKFNSSCSNGGATCIISRPVAEFVLTFKIKDETFKCLLFQNRILGYCTEINQGP